MILSKKQIRFDLKWFLIIIAILVCTGLIFIYSSSSVYALEKFGTPTYFVKKQLLGLFFGIIALCIMRYVPLGLIKKCSPLLLLGTVILTACTLLPGLSRHIHGSSRWLTLAGFSFQPSELLKYALIIYFAAFVAKKEKKPSSFMHGYLPLLIVLGVISILLLQQPDFGLTVTLLLTFILVLLVVQYQVTYLLLTAAAFLPVAIGLVVLKPYRLARVLTFINPWADPQGAGFQIIQSLIAIGSGGMWGLGIGQSKQKFFYLPMQHTDFIFSIIAEETGFFGCSILIMLYVLFLYFGLRIAWQLQDSFCTIFTIGFTFLISIQAAINLAVATGLAPTKGTGLPFVSYGNTALVCTLAMVGLIINMVYDHN